MKKKKILILGASGFLGQTLTLELKNTGHYDVCATSRALGKKDINFELDVCDSNKLASVFHDISPDIVFNLAVSHSQNFEEAYKTNFLSSMKLLDIASSHSKKSRIILIGSAAEYGLVNKEDNPIRETSILSPISTYGLTKSLQSQLVKYYNTTKKVDVVYARLFNLYGKNAPDSLLSGKILNQIQQYKKGLLDRITTGDLSQFRDFISIDRACEILLGLAHMGKSGEIYNVGSGFPTSCREFVVSLLNENGLDEKLLDEKNEPNKSKVDFIYADMAKTRELLELR